ncbi:hypothetical protein ACSSS7_006700 [Eimeria intestinalis]
MAGVAGGPSHGEDLSRRIGKGGCVRHTRLLVVYGVQGAAAGQCGSSKGSSRPLLRPERLLEPQGRTGRQFPFNVKPLAASNTLDAAETSRAAAAAAAAAAARRLPPGLGDLSPQ